MPFCEESFQFLFENRVRDDRAWFKEHRADYERLVLTPMQELVRSMTPAMLSVDQALICEPKVGRSISRLYRDTRFARDKAIFRDNVWCIFIRDKRLYGGLPAFYADISPRDIQYGCGYYKASADSMTAIRKLIVESDPSFAAVQSMWRQQETFHLEDTRYKRTRHPDEPEELRQWLDQRSICASAQSEDFDLLCSTRLGERLTEQLLVLAPLYEFLIKAESRKPKTQSFAGNQELT